MTFDHRYYVMMINTLDLLKQYFRYTTKHSIPLLTHLSSSRSITFNI
uniref:Uncharacterized protein n=1 Tax=Rhizophora mucronata TaxID=61149 RepID=A0A2P2QUK3_RHIMU